MLFLLLFAPSYLTQGLKGLTSKDFEEIFDHYDQVNNLKEMSK